MMPHKISKAQYDQLPIWPKPSLRKYMGWLPARRLLDGEGTDADLDEVVKFCIKHGKNALARELLMPPDGTRPRRGLGRRKRKWPKSH